MTTHQPPYMPGRTTEDRGMPMYHRLPHYLNDAPDMPQGLSRGPASRELEAARRAAHVTNAISDREQSDREVRSEAVYCAVRLFAKESNPVCDVEADNRAYVRDVLLVADVLAHYIASGVVPPAPRPAGALNLPLKLDSPESTPEDSDEPWPNRSDAA